MRLWLKVAAVDIVLLAAVYFVVGDMEWRLSYAAKENYGASYAYSILVHVLQMSKGSTALRSPPTFDWLQLLVVALVVLNLYLVLTWARTKGTSSSNSKETSGPQGRILTRAGPGMPVYSSSDSRVANRVMKYIAEPSSITRLPGPRLKE